jgi:hypothetical protein
MDEFGKMYGNVSIRSLNADQLHHLFSHVTTKDGALIAKIAAK